MNWYKICSICQQPRTFVKCDTMEIVVVDSGRVLTDPNVMELSPHESCEEVRRQRAEEAKVLHEEERRREDHQRRIRFLGETLGLPVEKISLLRLDHSGHTEHDRIVDRLTAWQPKRPGIVLSGKPGVGKTHLLRAMAIHVSLDLNQGIEWRNVNRWLDEIRTYAADNSARLEPSLARMERADVLFLDDVGAEKLTEWSETKLERILSYRLDFDLPVFASTNLTEGGLSEKFNSRTLSRLAGLCEFVTVKGTDFRPTLLRDRLREAST